MEPIRNTETMKLRLSQAELEASGVLFTSTYYYFTWSRTPSGLIRLASFYTDELAARTTEHIASNRADTSSIVGRYRELRAKVLVARIDRDYPMQSNN